LMLDCGAMGFSDVLLQKRDWLILIWTSFSSFIVDTYFFNTLLFHPKNLKIFGFQILWVIWDNSVFGQIERFWWQIFYLLYLTTIFKKNLSIRNH
jgi:hypothetical protein